MIVTYPFNIGKLYDIFTVLLSLRNELTCATHDQAIPLIKLTASYTKFYFVDRVSLETGFLCKHPVVRSELHFPSLRPGFTASSKAQEFSDVPALLLYTNTSSTSRHLAVVHVLLGNAAEVSIENESGWDFLAASSRVCDGTSCNSSNGNFERLDPERANT